MDRSHRYQPISGVRLFKWMMMLIVGLPILLFAALMFFLIAESVYKDAQLQKRAKEFISVTSTITTPLELETLAAERSLKCQRENFSGIQCEATLSSGFGFAVKYLTVTANVRDGEIEHPIIYRIWED